MGSPLWSRATRIFLLIVVFSFLWFYIALPHLPHNNQQPEQRSSIVTDNNLHRNPVSKFLRAIHFQNADDDQIIQGNKEDISPEEILEIREQIQLRSQNETIINEELFGPIKNDTIVIVVQVHNRLEYLRHLIISLAQARYIESVLLIFSHDVYDEDINRLITNIDFCKVLQIFYPYSLQTHPHSFPGESPADCPRDTNSKDAKKLHCFGTADIYNHYREARYTQTKHHWWWKANKVFSNVWYLKNHTGLVLFLEEDHYVSEDFLHMILILRKLLPQACSQCSLITLGNYIKNYNFPRDSKKVEIGQWISSKHNMGFAFNRSVWEPIKECGAMFCNHDDYNWDWSLEHTSTVCLEQKLFTISTRAPRVFHIGDCGVHHKNRDCSSKLILNKVRTILDTAQKSLFPHQMIVIRAVVKKLKHHSGNGGWGDIRDHALCRSFSQPDEEVDIEWLMSAAASSLMMNLNRIEIATVDRQLGAENEA